VTDGSEEPQVVGSQFMQLGRWWWAIRIVVPKVGVGVGGAADGQQPVSVMIEESARKLWRIMTDGSATDGQGPGVSHASSRSSTPRSSLQECPVQISHGRGRRTMAPS
jgi:hypothetical protein